MIRHCTVLANAGFNVLLTGRIKDQSKPLKEEAFQQKRLKCIFGKGKLFYLEYNIRLFWFLLFRKADIIVAVDFDTLLAGTLAAVIKRSKLVFDAHEYFTEVPELSGRELSRQVWDFLGNACMHRVDAAYTVGPALAKLFSSMYGLKFECILNVPPSRHPEIESKPEKEERVILYQGALNEGRGLEALINAMTKTDAILWLAGEGDLSHQLRTLCKQLKLENKVKFLGYISPTELPAITSQAWLGINILENKGLSYYYSLANKFFDYIHAGLPQLCAPFPEYMAINKEFEVALLCPNHEEDIVFQVNRLIQNQNLYLALQSNCRKAAEVFNLQAESEKLISIYKHLH